MNIYRPDWDCWYHPDMSDETFVAMFRRLVLRYRVISFDIKRAKWQIDPRTKWQHGPDKLLTRRRRLAQLRNQFYVDGRISEEDLNDLDDEVTHKYHQDHPTDNWYVRYYRSVNQGFE